MNSHTFTDTHTHTHRQTKTGESQAEEMADCLGETPLFLLQDDINRLGFLVHSQDFHV